MSAKSTVLCCVALLVKAPKPNLATSSLLARLKGPRLGHKKSKTNHLKTSLCYSSFPAININIDPAKLAIENSHPFWGEFMRTLTSACLSYLRRWLSWDIVRCLIPQPAHRYTQYLTRKSLLYLFTIMSSTNCTGKLDNHPFCLPENEQKNTIQKGKELQQYYTIASIYNITITLQVKVILNSWCQDHSPPVCLCTSAR